MICLQARKDRYRRLIIVSVCVHNHNASVLFVSAQHLALFFRSKTLHFCFHDLSHPTSLPPCTAAFAPQTRKQLKFAVNTCLKRWSPRGDCSKSRFGPIGDWDLSHVTDTNTMFYGALGFQGDISKWDVSRVTNMAQIFWGAISFNGDISK